jgi:uncharacterized protein (DUF2235 family)
MMPTKPKNIVICLDGTGNQIEENLSNVLKLYRTLEKGDDQVVFYDQGVGTLGQIYTWGWAWQELKGILGLGFGLGLDKNVLQAYEFIVQNYAEHKVNGESNSVGDNIYIFGFSRGAHTARVLAGLIYEVGIIRPDQIHLAGAALAAYKQTQEPQNDNNQPNNEIFEGEGANFRRVANTRTAAIKFLGCWDTVSSVFVPNAKAAFPPIVREKLPHTQLNPAVEIFRHGIAIDERRRMFRVDRWKPDQLFKPNIHSQGKPKKQCAKSVWFSGYHSDVGGGHERANSGLSQYPFIWMIEEAEKAGLKVFKRMANYVSGVDVWSSTTEYKYPKPRADASDHNSMTRIWSIAEIIPKHQNKQEWSNRKSFLGYYFPNSEPRLIETNAEIHSSVSARMESLSSYKPINLPKNASGHSE